MSNDNQRGVYRRYEVNRVNEAGEILPGYEDRTYYVLDVFNDPFAVDALRAYAKACRSEYPALANDLETLALEAQVNRLEAQFAMLKAGVTDVSSEH